MNDKVNDIIDTKNALTSIITQENFVKLDKNVQNKFFSTLVENDKKKGGIFGKIFGIEPANIALYFAIMVVICCFIIIIGDVVYSYLKDKDINLDLFQFLLPLITTALGYAFGKGTK